MPLNKFSNLEENINERDFIIDFKVMKLTSTDDLYSYRKIFDVSMKEFKFSIRMMFIFAVPGFLLILPGAILLYFAMKLNNRANYSSAELDKAISTYTSELEKAQS